MDRTDALNHKSATKAQQRSAENAVGLAAETTGRKGVSKGAVRSGWRQPP